MGKTMKQLPFGKLMEWVISEIPGKGAILGIDKRYRGKSKTGLELFGDTLELPFGPAAGPHTQLAQNLVAAYIAGARFFELKTVQALDGEDLPVSKPCIYAPDECYNVEWSTELRVPEAMDEYIKGWYAINLLDDVRRPGGSNSIIFNMSVGYDLDGIRSAKIDSFIEGLKNAENTETWKTCREWALGNSSDFHRSNRAYIDAISPRICNSITLSTLHGCPPQEIERIAAYLMVEKGLYTFVKCNPTMLGYDYARATLDRLGFDYIAFDDRHFKADLQFDDAVAMIGRLKSLADSLNLVFGVKLTNTFPVQISAGELPGDEMYMSGRALFPLSIELAYRLAMAFHGGLHISYSGGADIRNIGEIFKAGIWPITMATTLLKPGGYQRLTQIAEELAGIISPEPPPITAEDIFESMALRSASEADVKTPSSWTQAFTPRPGVVDLERLGTLRDRALEDAYFRKRGSPTPPQKISSRVPLLDCRTAPCRDGCPFGQDIPAYLRLAGEGKHLDALHVIVERNPLPFITGTLCSHRCTDKCVRRHYEKSVDIRAVKLEAAQKAFKDIVGDIKEPPKNRVKIAVVGGGPAGLSAAYFSAKAGYSATLFEMADAPGGVVRQIVPSFRISGEAVDNDVLLVRSMGIEIRTGTKLVSGVPGPGETTIERLWSEGFSRIVIATGAWKPGALDLNGYEAVDALEFLRRLRNNPNPSLGERVVVIGGGNTAMDAARAAKRVPGVKNVSLVYRRARRQMPADIEELEAALEEGVELMQLLAPTGYEDGALVCDVMRLGPPDASGRQAPIPTGDTAFIRADYVISAVGNNVDTDFYRQLGIPVDSRGMPVIDVESFETGLPGIHVIGDAAAGPRTIADAIADAAKFAKAALHHRFGTYENENVSYHPDIAARKKGVICKDCSQTGDPKRCLECATVCSLCVDVCPNRANAAIGPEEEPQIIHIDALCNECGNCETFCPYSSAPYRDKFTLFDCEEAFAASENPGFLPLGDGCVKIRIDGKVAVFRDGGASGDGSASGDGGASGDSSLSLPKGIWDLIMEARDILWS